MTPDQQRLVQDSWAPLASQAEALATSFYRNLFDIYPEVRPYFTGDMERQGRMWVSMVDKAVNELHDLEAVTEPLRHLGRAHRGYGVAHADYDKVGAAFLLALEQALGARFTADVAVAWQAAYDVMADAMKDGAGPTTVAGPSA